MLRHLLVKNRISVALILVSVFLFTFISCSKAPTISEEAIIGEITYSAPVYIMSLEKLDGEDEEGIVYREVLDFNKLVTQSNKTIVLYFYTTANPDVYGVTAGVEDMAQYYGDSITFVGINTIDKRDISTAYGIVALPEFVIIKDNQLISYFEGFNYEYWTMEDVENWIEENR